MIIDTQQAISSGLWTGIQIQSLTQQQRGRRTQRATESLHTCNLNKTWETGLRKRAVPTPREQRESVTISTTTMEPGRQMRTQQVLLSSIVQQNLKRSFRKTKQNGTFSLLCHQHVLRIWKLGVARRKEKSLKSTIHRADRKGLGRVRSSPRPGVCQPWGGVALSSRQKHGDVDGS